MGTGKPTAGDTGDHHHQVAARDPQTGKFVSQDMSGFDDFEIVTRKVDLHAEAAELDGSTGNEFGQRAEFEGIDVIDYDDVIDRNEMAVLVAGWHRLYGLVMSTATADGTCHVQAELSSAASQQAVLNFDPNNDIEDTTGDFVPRQRVQEADTFDVIGRPLGIMAGGPFSDGASGVGGSNNAGTDDVTVSLPAAAAEFDARDNVFLNGAIEAQNISDASIVAVFYAYHVYGVTSR